MEVFIRDKRDSDTSFIFATWLKNYKNCSSFAKRIRESIFYSKHHQLIEWILQKPTTVVKVACDPTDHEAIRGYLVYERTEDHVIHYMFVKSTYQGFGIAKTLLQSSGIDPNFAVFTHWTYPMNEITRKYNLVYDPYRI